MATKAACDRCYSSGTIWTDGGKGPCPVCREAEARDWARLCERMFGAPPRELAHLVSDPTPASTAPARPARPQEP